jgi:hypothetical protein
VLKQDKRQGLLTHLVNIYRLSMMIKELKSIRADPMMLVLVLYTFSVAVYTVATGARSCMTRRTGAASSANWPMVVAIVPSRMPSAATVRV